MTENEIRLINIIRSHNRPAKAVLIAIKIIQSFLKQLESYPKPFSAEPRELG